MYIYIYICICILAFTYTYHMCICAVCLFTYHTNGGVSHVWGHRRRGRWPATRRSVPSVAPLCPGHVRIFRASTNMEKGKGYHNAQRSANMYWYLIYITIDMIRQTIVNTAIGYVIATVLHVFPHDHPSDPRIPHLSLHLQGECLPNDITDKEPHGTHGTPGHLGPGQPLWSTKDAGHDADHDGSGGSPGGHDTQQST